MVKAELSYNPYLQETEIRFNGQSPRINSHVEKYLDKKLQTWIHKLPYIFRDEMNGYGFELEFSGTELDYEELKRSFSDAGVSDDVHHIVDLIFIMVYTQHLMSEFVKLYRDVLSEPSESDQ